MYEINPPARKLPVAVAALIVAVGSTVAGCGDAGAKITRLTVGSPGPDRYTLASGTDRQDVQRGQNPGGKRDGDAPGLYGGTRQAATCAPSKLVEFLRANPDKAKAWAGVHRIDASGIQAYVAKLTPVTLRSDTFVTNHGFRDGKPTSFPAVLQAGMGVLVDRYGAPVVKCNCGNPLTAPSGKIDPDNATYKGRSWAQFERRKVTIVRPRPPAKGEVTTFTLVDPGMSMAFSRPPGTAGEQDGPPSELPPGMIAGPTGEPTAEPTSEPTAEPTGPTGGPTEPAVAPTEAPPPGYPTQEPQTGPPPGSQGDPGAEPQAGTDQYGAAQGQ